MTTTTVPPSPPNPPLSPPPSETLGRQLVFPSTRAPVASPIGWSAIFAAAAVAIGLWLLLHSLGIGIGLAALDPNEKSSLRAAGIGLGIWSLLVPIIAMFIGGLVAGRTAPTFNTFSAIVHGIAAWAITAIGSVLVFATLLGATMSVVASSGSAAELGVNAQMGEAPGAADAAHTTGAVMLGLGVTMGLTLIAAIIGAAIGVRRERRDYVRQARAV